MILSLHTIIPLNTILKDKHQLRCGGVFVEANKATKEPRRMKEVEEAVSKERRVKTKQRQGRGSKSNK